MVHKQKSHKKWLIVASGLGVPVLIFSGSREMADALAKRMDRKDSYVSVRAEPFSNWMRSHLEKEGYDFTFSEKEMSRNLK